MSKTPKILAAGDVAEILDVSYQYIDRLAREGRLPFQMTSSGKVFLEQDVLAFQKERERKAKTDPRIKRSKKKG